MFWHVHCQLDELPHRSAWTELPGNGSLLATHADRKALFLEAGRLVVELTRRYYVEDDDRVLPRTLLIELRLRMP